MDTPATTPPRHRDHPFGSGVASGDVTDTSVVLWTRIDPAGLGLRGAEVAWTIGLAGIAGGDDVGPDGAERAGVVRATAEHDHCVHVEVDGLRPGTDYEFSFACDGGRASGRTRTLPTTTDRFRFAVACCSRWGWPGFDLFDAIAAESPDLLVHLGDSIYEVGEVPPSRIPTDPRHDCETLDDYRRRYRQHHSDVRLRRLLAQVPMHVIWDDHEVADNAPDPDDGRRRRAGQRAWAEWTPSRRVDEPRPLDRQLAIGGLLDLAIVDSRFGGRIPKRWRGPAPVADGSGQILDDGQWQRLTTFATASSTPWFVVANQVQVAPMILAALPSIAGRRRGAGWWKPVVNPDQWDGFPAERSRLCEVLRRVSSPSVVLSGDLHSAWSRTLRDDDGDVAHEFTCPSISGLTFAQAVRRRLPMPTRLLEWWVRRLNDGIDRLELDHHGFLVCDVTPTTFTTTLVRADGERHRLAVLTAD